MRKRIIERFGALLLSAALMMTTAAFALPEAAEYSAPASESVRRQEYADFALDKAQLREWDAEPMGRRLPSLPEAGTYCEGELLVKVGAAFAALSAEEDPFEAVVGKYVEDMEYLFSVGDEMGVYSDDMEDGAEQEQIWLRLMLREDADMLTAWREIAACDSVITVEPNYIRTASEAAKSTAEISDSDPYIHAQTWLDSMNAVSAWTWLDSMNAVSAWRELAGAVPGVAANGEPIIVAVVDSGVDMDHPDLAGKLLAGYDFVEQDNNPDDENGHGTHVAGIIAAENNAIGVRGVAYGAKLLPVRVLDQNGSGSSANIAAGILYAADQGAANIINLSLGGYGASQAEQDAIQHAREKGCLVIAAAGNESAPTVAVGSYGGAVCTPANCPGVLTVMAANDAWELASFSNYDNDPGEGAEYELMAPGVDILSTTFDGGYGRMSGTSMACPAAAGAAAVLMGMGCTAEDTFALLATCAKKTVTVNGASFDYPALDLDECVSRAAQLKSPDSAAVDYPVNVTNGWVSASLAPQNFDHSDVDFGGMNTTSRVYFRNNGDFVSTLSVEMENIGGAGDVKLTGLVGGCTVDQTLTLAQGETRSVGLQFSGTPEVDADGYVLVKLYANETLLCERRLAAYELKTPADSGAFNAYTYEGYTAYLMNDGVSYAALNGTPEMGVVWVIDEDIAVFSNQTLDIYPRETDKGVVVYEAKNKAIQVYYGDSGNYGELYAGGAALLACTAFQTLGNGYAEYLCCDIYDPFIEWFNYMSCCSVWGNGHGGLKLNGFSAYETGFYSMRGIDIQCTYFLRNMVNDCCNMTLRVERLAQANTFVENFGNTSDSIMTVYAPDYSGSEQATYVSDDANAEFPYSGFCFNSVIGPMSVYNAADSSLAKVYKVYYQAVNSNDITVTPEGAEDKLHCAVDPTVSSDISSNISSDIDDLREWGFAADSPAFILGTECTDYNINSGGWIDYSVDVYFSTPVNTTNRIYPDSVTDDMIGSARVYLDKDGRYCTITGSSINKWYDTVNYYSVSDFFTQNKTISEDVSHHFGWAALQSQTTFRYPVAFGDQYYRSGLDSVNVTMNNDGSRTVTWEDTRLTEDHKATVERSTDGGESYTELASNIAEKSYVDTDAMQPDTLLIYRVKMSAPEDNSYTGTARFLLALSEQDMGLDLAVEKFTDDGKAVFSASLNGMWLINDHLTLTLPGVDYCNIEFGDAVRDAGILYGAITTKNETDVPTTTVYIGSGDSAFLPGGEPLFTVTMAPDNSASRTVTANREGSGADRWGKNGQCHYVTTSNGKMGWNEAGTQAALYSKAGRMLAAYYLPGGQMKAVHEVENELYSVEEGSVLKAFFLSDAFAPICELVKVGPQALS